MTYSVNGYEYTLTGLLRDFAFVPAKRKAVIVALEKWQHGIVDNPLLLDAVFQELSSIQFDFLHHSGLLSELEFMEVFQGDQQAIREFGASKGVSYLIMVLTDCHYLQQMSLQGKTYDIFTSKTRTTMRIVRVSDGKILYSRSVGDVKGQGGTEEKAMIDGFQKTAEEMTDAIRQDRSEISGIFEGI